MSLETRVLATVFKNLEKDLEVTLESRLIEDLEVDSLNKLMIIAGLEDEFEITINEGDFRQISTVGEIVVQLRKRYPELEGESNAAE